MFSAAASATACSMVNMDLLNSVKEAGQVLRKEWIKQLMGIYHRSILPPVLESKLSDDTILVQRQYDAGIAVIKIPEERYETFYPTLSEADYARLTVGEDGFEQIHRESIVMKYESRIFSLEDYLNDFTDELMVSVRERQMKANQNMAANLDGSCGEKIHSFMINMLKKESGLTG